jgi:long-chain-fatty-acid--CoA ligase ACSBG
MSLTLSVLNEPISVLGFEMPQGVALALGIVVATVLFQMIAPKPKNKGHKWGDQGGPPGTVPDPLSRGRHFITSKDDKLDIVLAEDKNSVAGQNPFTIPECFGKILESKADKVAMRHERGADMEWSEWTWGEYHDQIRTAAKAMINLGLEDNGCCNIIGFNSPEWFIANCAAIFCNAKSAGIYTTNSASACEYVTNHSEAAIVVVEDRKQLEKFLSIKKNIPTVKAVIVYDGEVKASDSKGAKFDVMTWDDFMAIGREEDDAELEERLEKITPNSTCTLIYTSGTTGNPKAVMISHDNILFEANSVMKLLPWVAANGREEHIISYLPLSHVAGNLVDILMPIICTALRSGTSTTHFARPTALKGTLGDTLRAVRPTMFLGVPRVWEKISEMMKKKGKANKGAKLALIKWAKAKGLVGALTAQVGGDNSKPWGYTLAKTLVFKKVRAQLGLDRCRFAFTGAAPITTETLGFFGALGLPICEVYGMSESCGATTWSTPECHKWGSVGFPLPGTEIKIDHDSSRDKPGEGEICFRGRHIMQGYMNNEAKCKSAIDAEGWLHSGDVGRIDEEGLVYITGRIKELIITAGGENIAPVPIEDAIKANCPFISNIMMVGDKRKYNVALVTLKSVEDKETGGHKDELDGAAKDTFGDISVTEAMDKQEVLDAIQEGITKYNKSALCVSNAQKIQYFKVLDKDFSVPGGDLTATLKLKRSVVAEKYADVIDSMYKK